MRSFKILLCIFFLCSAVNCDDFSRKMSLEANPGCLDQLTATQCDSHRVWWVSAEATDTLHLLVSVWDVPSVLLLRTPLNVDPAIDWKKLISDDPSGAVTVKEHTAAYAVSLDELIEFDDPADNADLFKSKNITYTRMDELQMADGECKVVTNSSALIEVTVKSLALNATSLGTSGTVTFKFQVLNSERRSEELPHLQQTGNSAIVSVVLDDLKTDSQYNHSRFGVSLTSFGTLPLTLQETKSLDDEYTPGVFKLVSLSSSDPSKSGFLQWRPVTYTDPDFTIEHSTTARHYNVTPQTAAPHSALLRAFFGTNTPSASLPVTFGLAEDGWYKDSSYAAWSTTAGVGSVPADKFSITVILLLSIGLGVPAAALVVGMVWIVVRRLRGGSERPLLEVDEEE